MRILKIILALFGLLFVTASLAAAAIPGPQRMIAPTWFGFNKVALNIYAPASMTKERKMQAVRDIRAGEQLVSRFFDQPLARPWIVLCPRNTCDAAFGEIRTRGVAYGAHLIRLNDKGINHMIAVHELSHIALKRRVGNVPSFFGAIPAWFDEGLATLLSNDQRYANAYPRAVQDDLLSAGPWWNWGDVIKRNGWQAAYGESRNMTRQLFQKIGRKGILQILDDVAGGKDFDSALKTEHSS